MIKDKSAGFLLLLLKANSQQFNLFTMENQMAVHQSTNILSHFLSVLQKTIVPVLASPLIFWGYFLYFKVVKEEKGHAKEEHFDNSEHI